MKCGDEPVAFFLAKAALFSSVGIEASNEQAWVGIESQTERAEHVQFAEDELGAECRVNLLQRNMRCGEKGVQPPSMVG